MVVVLGYRRIYGFESGGIERLKIELSEYNLLSVLQSLSKVSLRLNSKGFTNQDNQIGLVRDIFANDLPFRRLIFKAIKKLLTEDKDKDVVWSLFFEQSLLLLFKLAIMYSKRDGGKFVEESDVQRLGNWLLISNDICSGDGNTLELEFPPEIERELLREYLTRQHAFMARERMPYRFVRFWWLFDNLTKQPGDFDIAQHFYDATGGVNLNDYISFVFFLIVNYVNKTTKEVNVANEWIVCKNKYFEKTQLTSDEVEKISTLLLLDLNSFENGEKEIINRYLHGRDVVEFNFMQFYKRPLIPFDDNCFICPSPEMLMDKGSSGIYWILENYFRENQLNHEHNLLPVKWGESFHTYIGKRLSEGFGDNYVNAPMEGDSEICDGLLVGKHAIFVIETKYAHWSYLAKMTGKREHLQSMLENIFSSTRKVKGLGQIVRAIKKFESGYSIANVDMSDRYFVPLLVVGEGLPMDLLNRKYYEDEAIASGAFYANKRVMPFIVLDAEEVEMLGAIVQQKGVEITEQILLRYSSLFIHRNDKGLAPESMQFKNFLISSKTEVINNKIMFKEFDYLHKQAIKFGFRRLDSASKVK